MAVVAHLGGLTDYRDAYVLQRALLDERIDGRIPDVILLLQHRPVVTLGRGRDAADGVLEDNELPVVETERGGNATWHGPGQLVAYPIVALPPKRQDLRWFLTTLEEALIRLLREHRLDPTRDARNTGIWLPVHRERPRKVASIGIACRRWVTWHGLALNVDNARDAFDVIRPCGFDAGIMTRLADHLDPCPTVDALAPRLGQHLLDTLELPRSTDAEHVRLRKLIAEIGSALPPRPTAPRLESAFGKPVEPT